MRIDDLLRAHPWETARAALCATPDQLELARPLEFAETIIREQRSGQLDSLVSLMFTPVRATPRGFESDPSEIDERWERRDPRRTARLFLERAARPGKNLWQFQPQRLQELGDDAPLAQVLRWLAVALELSKSDRPAEYSRIQRIVRTGTGFGVVLTPMVQFYEVEQLGRDAPAVTRLAEAIMGRLEPIQGTTKSPPERRSLVGWTWNLAREGTVRLWELGGRA